MEQPQSVAELNQKIDVLTEQVAFLAEHAADQQRRLQRQPGKRMGEQRIERIAGRMRDAQGHRSSSILGAIVPVDRGTEGEQVEDEEPTAQSRRQ